MQRHDGSEPTTRGRLLTIPPTPARFLAVILVLVSLSVALYYCRPGVVYGSIDFLLRSLQAGLDRNAPGYLQPVAEHPSASEVTGALPPWSHLPGDAGCQPGNIRIGGDSYDTLAAAARRLRDRETMVICEGNYAEPLLINTDYNRIVGSGRVILEHVAHGGMAAIVVRGRDTLVENIECRFIAVADANGACLRLVGSNLHLRGVYFHSSQQGLLTTAEPGLVTIENSRFENLGYAGRAHGVYAGGGELRILSSDFLAMKNGAHAVKTRATLTLIRASLIAGLSSNGGRLVDVSNGGEIRILDSVLQLGVRSDNWDAIGYGLEASGQGNNTVTLVGNRVLLDRPGPGALINAGIDFSADIRDNVIVSRWPQRLPGRNRVFRSRADAGLAPYPALPTIAETQRADSSQ